MRLPRGRVPAPLISLPLPATERIQALSSQRPARISKRHSDKETLSIMVAAEAMTLARYRPDRAHCYPMEPLHFKPIYRQLLNSSKWLLHTLRREPNEKTQTNLEAISMQLKLKRRCKTNNSKATMHLILWWVTCFSTYNRHIRISRSLLETLARLPNKFRGLFQFQPLPPFRLRHLQSNKRHRQLGDILNRSQTGRRWTSC